MQSSQTDSKTIAVALRFGREFLQDVSETADLDSQLLLGHALSLSRLDLVVESKRLLTEIEFVNFTEYLERRKAFEPIAYITGKKEFWGLEFEVSPVVLIPRPDSELLLETALTFCADFPDPLLIADLGTGSGCLAIALAFELNRRSRNYFMLAVDRSIEALKLAKKNAAKHQLENYVNFLGSNWSSAIGQDFDIVISNPPYLLENESGTSKELKYEPTSALYAGKDGLNDYRKIFQDLPKILSRNGVFLGEFGYGQAHSVEKLARDILGDPHIEFHNDLRKIQRVVEIRLG